MEVYGPSPFRGAGPEEQHHNDFPHVHCLDYRIYHQPGGNGRHAEKHSDGPLSFPALLAGKLAVCGLLSLFLGIVSTVFTVTASFLLGFPGGDFPAVMQAGLQITANCLFLYIAVLPIIAIAARIPNGHLIERW